MTTIRTYSELIEIPSFRERFEYLKLGSSVGAETFGVERYLNQVFYRSKEWKQVRDLVLIRDSFDGCPCDLAHPDHPVYGRVIIHHLNPITIEDIERKSKYLLDPEYLITTIDRTHNAIHYSSYDLLPQEYIPRHPNDTCPWRH